MFLLSPVRLTLFLLVFLDVPHPSFQGRNKGRWNKGGKFWEDYFSQRLSLQFCLAGWGFDPRVSGNVIESLRKFFRTTLV